MQTHNRTFKGGRFSSSLLFRAVRIRCVPARKAKYKCGHCCTTAVAALESVTDLWSCFLNLLEVFQESLLKPDGKEKERFMCLISHLRILWMTSLFSQHLSCILKIRCSSQRQLQRNSESVKNYRTFINCNTSENIS